MAIFGLAVISAFIFLLSLSFWLSIKPLKLKEVKSRFDHNSISAKDAKKTVEQDRKKDWEKPPKRFTLS